MTDAYERLVERLRTHERLLTAFSGGADSALLAVVAHRVLGERAVAVTAVSASLPERERAAAREFARAQGLRHVEVCTDELDRAEYVRNGGDRCFHCKTALFDALAPLAAISGARVALGTNLDDLGDYRPGQAAATAYEVAEPELNRLISVHDDLLARLQPIGFAFITVDLAGFRSGGMNTLLQLSPAHKAN